MSERHKVTLRLITRRDFKEWKQTKIFRGDLSFTRDWCNNSTVTKAEDLEMYKCLNAKIGQGQGGMCRHQTGRGRRFDVLAAWFWFSYQLCEGVGEYGVRFYVTFSYYLVLYSGKYLCQVTRCFFLMQSKSLS